jgi:hypothetical protein
MRKLIKNSLKKMWKEMVLAQFKVQSWHMPVKTEENYEKPQSG